MGIARGLGIGAVLGALGLAAGVAALSPPIPQDPGYHRFADGRTLLGIPHALNVVSNGGFVLVGAAGAWALRPGGDGSVRFRDSRERWAWGVFFVGLLLTGVGSAYYHLSPGNDRLVWDRLPLAAALMGLLAATVMERIGVQAGLVLLGPLVALGLWSVLSWHAGELRGQGDLRLYALVQFYPLVAVPLMLWLFAPRYTLGGAVMATVAIYGIAKLFEVLDAPILGLGEILSGHTLKHLTAAAAGAVIVWMLRARRVQTHVERGRT